MEPRDMENRPQETSGRNGHAGGKLGRSGAAATRCGTVFLGTVLLGAVLLGTVLLGLGTLALGEDAPAPAPAPAPVPAPAKDTPPAEAPKAETPSAEAPKAPPLIVTPKDLPGLMPMPKVEEAPPLQTDPQAVAIVDAYLKAIGGTDALRKVSDRTTKFMNVKSGATGDTEVEINLYMKKLAGNALGIREEWDVKGFDIKGMPLAFTQIYNGKVNEGWVLMLGTVSALDGKTLQVFVWDKYIDDFLCHWENDGYTLTLAGMGVVPKDVYGEEHACDVVNVTDFTGRQSARYFFSRSNGLLIKKEWLEAGANPKGQSRKEQYYKDYRELGFMDNSGLAVKFPLRLEIYLDGDLDTVRRFTNVQFNSGLSEKLFDKPEGKPFEKAVTGAKTEPKEPADTEQPGPKAPHSTRRPGVKVISPIPGTEGSTPPAPEPKAETTPPAPAPQPAPETPKS